MLRKYNPINAHQAGATATQGRRPGRKLGQQHTEQHSFAAVALNAFAGREKFQPHNELSICIFVISCSGVKTHCCGKRSRGSKAYSFGGGSMLFVPPLSSAHWTLRACSQTFPEKQHWFMTLTQEALLQPPSHLSQTSYACSHANAFGAAAWGYGQSRVEVGIARREECLCWVPPDVRLSLSASAGWPWWWLCRMQQLAVRPGALSCSAHTH